MKTAILLGLLVTASALSVVPTAVADACGDPGLINLVYCVRDQAYYAAGVLGNAVCRIVFGEPSPCIDISLA
ncbi:MAG TPA: hypothetical protein VNX21_04290 [Candidatus Thermoplasmatota archaeon]|nr:hypothetical protein [Candidatus Thermoplasmatota archaeon]